MDIFEIVQWALRALLALYFLFIGSSLFRPVQREAAVTAVSRLLPKAARWLVFITGFVAMLAGIALLLPWWAPRFAAGIVLIGLLIALFPVHMAAAKTSADPNQGRVSVATRAVVQGIIGALVLVAII